MGRENTAEFRAKQVLSFWPVDSSNREIQSRHFYFEVLINF